VPTCPERTDVADHRDAVNADARPAIAGPQTVGASRGLRAA
jgi:hypothetical protein